MKSLLRYLTTILFFNACATSTQMPRSQLEIREFQTKYFEVKDKIIITKAIINALLDEGFIINNANNELGIITAEKGYEISKNYESEKSNNILGLIIVGTVIILTLGLILLISKNKESDGNSNNKTNYNSNETTYEKNKIIQATISISEFSNGFKVRAVFQSKTLNNKGEIVKIEQIEDINFYQKFFEKLDKSIFLQKELEIK
ncbi:MAG: hypothetical protein ABIL76_03190 [candidate division WOR-3 bacterium]